MESNMYFWRSATYCFLLCNSMPGLGLLLNKEEIILVGNLLTYNLKSLVEKNFMYQTCAKSFYQCFYKKYVGDNRNQAQKLYLGNQTLG